MRQLLASRAKRCSLLIASLLQTTGAVTNSLSLPLPSFFTDTTKYRNPYFLRISLNFVKIFEKIPFNRKDYFFGHFSDVLAFSLLMSFYAAYPKSKNRIDTMEFKQTLIDLMGEWICGFKNSKKCEKVRGASETVRLKRGEAMRRSSVAERLTRSETV